ncbi:Membrane metallo-endopeptidase-like 1 [Apodemus speciosus]|uniref:Membrane metallo-endopeptidase-like 1 n=1 Tax=Apodemus speciosus TaxID=105296 RepID=A0ABQ0EQI2_APOSI
MVERTDPSGNKRLGSLEYGLLVLLLLLLLGAIVTLGVFYSIALRDSSQKSDICTTPGCVIAGILQNMDQSRNPCENFYQYACGGWLRHHVIPETNSRYSVFDILRDELEVILKGEEWPPPEGVLEDSTAQHRPAVEKAKTLYRSCMNQSVIEKRDSEPLLKVLNMVGGWPVAMDKWNETVVPQSPKSHSLKWELERQLAVLNSQFNRRVLIDLFIWNDDQNSSRHVIYIDQPTLGMPSREYYFKEGNNRKVREAYLQFMTSVATMLRKDLNLPKESAMVREEMAEVLALETHLANATVPQEKRHDVTALYHRMDLVELQDRFGLKGFNWTLFIQNVLSSVGVELLPDEEVVVYGIPYLENLDEIIDVYSARTMQNYLVWRLVLDRIGSLSQRFKEARVDYRKALYGTTVEEVRWRECVSYVNSNMESAVGSLYIKRAFSKDSKSTVRELIEKVRSVFVDNLDELNWMDEESKKKAQEKAMNIREQIGYPDYILEDNNRHLDEEYSSLTFSEDLYFENGLQNLKNNARRSLKKLREKVDQNLWIIGAAVVNAFYSPNRNLIGRNFDKNGNMLDWWSNFSARHFQQQSQCMIYQYGNFSWELADNQNVNGFSTLGENIADNGGVRQAYKAYLQWLAEGGKDQRLPGLDLTYAQLFFINYAQVWCGSATQSRPKDAFQNYYRLNIRHSPYAGIPLLGFCSSVAPLQVYPYTLSTAIEIQQRDSATS